MRFGEVLVHCLLAPEEIMRQAILALWNRSFKGLPKASGGSILAVVTQTVLL